MSRPAWARHQRAASSGSSQAANGTGRWPCLRREKRSSSAAATVTPSMTRAAAGSWNSALTPRTFATSTPFGRLRLRPPVSRTPLPKRTRSGVHDPCRRGNRGRMLISVLGTGYLGATHAACLAASCHDVIGVDRDPGRLAVLRSGRAPFHEAGLDELVRDGVASGRLRFTDDPADVADAEVHFLCVGTPQADDGDGAD